MSTPAMIRDAKRLTFYAAYAALTVALLCGVSGCSYIFDFSECEADEECRRFDAPEEGEFFMCSDDKCVLEPERECREDAHCADEQTCNDGQCVE